MSMNTTVIAKAREYALSEIRNFGTPISVHFVLSEKKAIELAKKLNADLEIVKIGIVLMDLKLGQALKENRLSEHVKMSSEAAQEFLKKFDLDGEKKKKIINCIEAHHGKVSFICMEAEICANADCYRFIHPRGFFAYLTLLSGERGLGFNECLNQAESKLEEKHKILSLDICKQELEDYYQTLKKFVTEAKKV